MSLSNLGLSTSTKLSSRFMKAATAARTYQTKLFFLLLCGRYCWYLYPVVCVRNLEVNPGVVSLRSFPASVNIPKWKQLLSELELLLNTILLYQPGSSFITWEVPEFPVFERQPEVKLLASVPVQAWHPERGTADHHLSNRRKSLRKVCSCWKYIVIKYQIYQAVEEKRSSAN